LKNKINPRDILSPVVGSTYSYTQTFRDKDVRLFSLLTGDDNPIHIDEAYAASSRFGRRVVHGMLTGSMFTTIFGKYYPGPGGIYLEQNLKFIRPVFVDDPVIAMVELLSFDPEKRIGEFGTYVHDGNDQLLVKGHARVMFPPVDI
jgi:3-hydroxybutyryl-CoA dehydratase